MSVNALSCLCLLLLCSLTSANNIQQYLNERNDSNSLQNHKYVEDHETKDVNCTSFIVEEEYELLRNGSLFVPHTQSVHDFDQYYLKNNLAYVCTTDEHEAVPSQEPGETYYRYSEDFLSCGHVLIEPHEYKLLKNGTVHIEIYSKLYEPTDYLIHERGVYVCVPKYEEMQNNTTSNNSTELQLNKFSESFAYVTYIGISLSIVSLLSHLIVFCTVSSVRNLPGCCLASLSLSLLDAYICFIGSAFVDTTESCAAIGVCIYYFFLAAFFWMNAIAFDVWRSFRVVTKELRISSNRISWKRFLVYSVYSWMTPAILVVAVRMADMNDLFPADLKPSFGAPICWFGQRKALLLFFATPLFIVMLLNAVFFLDVTCVISKAAFKIGQSHQDANLKKRFFMFLKLALIMGLTWIVGIVAGMVDNQVLWYLFVILNTLQGLFIFVVFSLSSKVKALFCKKISKRSQSGMSTSVRTISQAI